MNNQSLPIQIDVEIKNVYGSQLIYPASLGAKILAEMLGKKTLSARDISYAAGLGVKIGKESMVKLMELQQQSRSAA